MSTFATGASLNQGLPSRLQPTSRLNRPAFQHNASSSPGKLGGGSLGGGSYGGAGGIYAGGDGGGSGFGRGIPNQQPPWLGPKPSPSISTRNRMDTAPARTRPPHPTDEPCIKCSTCGQQVPMSNIGDHICDQSGVHGETPPAAGSPTTGKPVDPGPPSLLAARGESSSSVARSLRVDTDRAEQLGRPVGLNTQRNLSPNPRPEMSLGHQPRGSSSSSSPHLSPNPLPPPSPRTGASLNQGSSSPSPGPSRTTPSPSTPVTPRLPFLEKYTKMKETQPEPSPIPSPNGRDAFSQKNDPRPQNYDPVPQRPLRLTGSSQGDDLTDILDFDTDDGHSAPPTSHDREVGMSVGHAFLNGLDERSPQETLFDHRSDTTSSGSVIAPLRKRAGTEPLFKASSSSPANLNASSRKGSPAGLESLDDLMDDLTGLIDAGTKVGQPGSVPVPVPSRLGLSRGESDPSLSKISATPSRDTKPVCASCKRLVLPSSSSMTRSKSSNILVEKDGQRFCNACYVEKYLPRCQKCSKPIEGGSVSSGDGKVLGRYHPQCFSCFQCQAPFPDKEFYVWDRKPYCARHYHQLNGSLCANKTCGQGVEGRCVSLTDERGGKYHPNCFACSHRPCGLVLHDYHFVVKGLPYCERHVDHYWRIAVSEERTGGRTTDRVVKRQTIITGGTKKR